MLIDWFTVGAQALNFLILVWLMKRFLYKPILHAIEEREKKIAAELADADKKKAEAQKESDEFNRKNEELDKQRTELMKKATDEAQTERQRLLESARKTADILRAKQQETFRTDAQNLYQTISLRTQEEVFAIVRKALGDLAATDLEERMAEVLIRRLKEIDNGMKEAIKLALKTTSAPALIRSTFDLSELHRTAIKNALNESFSKKLEINFEIAPDLICGIEFAINGFKVSWNMADYISSLEKGVEELLKEKDKIEINASSGLAPQIAERAYQLYEKHEHKNDSSIEDWRNAEKEIREGQPEGEPQVKTENPK